MPIYDRYLLQLFVKVLLVCFFSITGLYVVIDACNNLDEFLNYGRRMGGVLPVLTDYYSARVPWFFDQISGLLTLIASMFAVTWLRRTNEMTALQAAGISAVRITRPLLAAAVVVSLLAAANREVVIPQVRDKLTRNAQNWLGEAGRPVEPVTDNRSGILISGRHVIAAEQRIEQATFGSIAAWAVSVGRLRPRMPTIGLRTPSIWLATCSMESTQIRWPASQRHTCMVNRSSSVLWIRPGWNRISVFW